jgi:D-lactate dehydrogenase
MKIATFSSREFEKPYLSKAANDKHQITFFTDSLNEKTANLAQGNEAVCLFTADDASAKVLELLHNFGVKHIALRSVGFDHVDLKKCHELGIKVANVPEYSPFSVAEHAMTLALCLNRKIKLGQKLTANGDFRLDQLVGFDMNQKTIGIIGTGKIGATFAKIAAGFGSELIAYDVKENETLKKELKIRYVTLDELCAKSDIISLHCPLNSSTKHLLNREKFSLMKGETIIINTARGPVINTQDLLEALDQNRIGAAGLDVYEFEKGLFFNDHSSSGISDKTFKSLQERPNVLITGHQGFLTTEALTNIAETTIYNLDCWNKNQSTKNELV